MKICYNNEKGQIGKTIDKLQSLVLTTDCWKSIQNFDYIGVTAHYIDETFQNQSITLATRHITGGKSAKNISVFLIANCYDFHTFLVMS